ncbi:tetratricopeptide repeat protein [Ghiorsea bivora]|uniref:tetratricopeptide repeat protein n=1 Tax=Ghiorsea bivora TaxID=1485545 RepID=UPI0009DCED4B|nr:tetratricopeptide repeat protein [Ghiorsea bivora]
MPNIYRILFSSLCMVVLLHIPTLHAENIKITRAASFLQQGAPNKTISFAQQLLATPQLSESERKQLLELIAQAEVMIASARHYEDVHRAVAAIETLIKEFPEQVDEPTLLTQIIDLYWKQDALEEAQASILDLQSRFPASQQAQDSMLTLGKIYFIHHRLADARRMFLRFALHVKRDSAQGREVQLWTALVDYEEGRYDQALPVFEKIYRLKPELITAHDNIYARYINLLNIQGKKRQALIQTRDFLKTFKTSSHSPSIRLLQADLLLGLPNPPIEDVARVYELLADKEANTVIGRKAFMRKLMIQMRDKHTYYDIKPAIIALKRIANQNQMSIVEDEAFLHEAELWEKVAQHDPKNSPKAAGDAALQQFTRASKSIDQPIAQQAKALGHQSFKRQMNTFIQQQAWLKAITLWQRFPNFRPPAQDSTQLRFAVAHGLRLLMEYEQAEQMLASLQQQAQGSVWGEKVMLERAKLWLDRQDPQGIQKVLQWLDKHEYTLYRPEMLVIVAHMQIQNKDATSASHTLDSVAPEDLTKETRAEYWKVQALTSEKLSRWHVAAHAWRMYAKYQPDDIDQAMLNQANALFKGKDYLRAEQLYQQTPQTLQNPEWQYRYSVCQLKSGKWNQAIERLKTLKANPDAGIYASMASLTLAEREAERLIKENP